MAVVRSASLLRSLRDKPRRLLAIFAHPDDEAYGCAGALARAGADSDTAAVLLCMTRGEASSMGPREGLTPEEVAAVRTKRLEEVAEIVHLDGLLIGGLPDGRLADVPLEEAARPIAEALASLHPQLVITGDARGLNAHPDHIAVHWLVRHALVGHEHVRLAMVAYTQEASDAAAPRLLFPTPEEQIDARLALRAEEIDAKEACLRVHDALVTLREDGAEGLQRRPPVENYAFLGEHIRPQTDDLFRSLPP